MNIKMKNQVLFLFVMAALVIGGCKKASIDGGMDQYYEVNFLKSDSQVFATAKIQYQGRAVTFEDRTLLTANGLVENTPYSSATNSFSWGMSDTNSVAFRLMRTDNSVVENTVSKSSIEDLTLVMDTVLYTSDTMRLSTLGAPISIGESGFVSMFKIVDSTGITDGMSAYFTGNDYEFDYLRTRDFHPGKYLVTVSRSKNIPLQQKDGAGVGDIAVTITDKMTVEVR